MQWLRGVTAVITRSDIVRQQSTHAQRHARQHRTGESVHRDLQMIVLRGPTQRVRQTWRKSYLPAPLCRSAPIGFVDPHRWSASRSNEIAACSSFTFSRMSFSERRFPLSRDTLLGDATSVPLTRITRPTGLSLTNKI